ncbi:hypothetical protein ACFSUM_05185 [Virgibacillus siamensis]|uniref:hypothetical protein n=1 Tax=Virgibacillus siamensis TaxID=480071 RepID=UPI0031E27DF0
MDSFILQIVFVCGIIFGLMMFLSTITRKSNKDTYQMMLSIAVVVMCVTSFLLTID